MTKVRSKHNSLLNYFLYDKQDLSPAYVRKCEEFIDSLGSAKLADCFKMEKPQASSTKRQAASLEELDPTINWNKLIDTLKTEW